MPEVLESLTDSLTGIGTAISTLTTIKIDITNKVCRYVAWTLKTIAQIIEIVLGGILLGTEIVPNLLKIGNSPDHTGLENPEGYRHAAYAYIVFFSIEFITDIVYWTYTFVHGGRHTSVIVSLLLALFCEMPIMMCGLYMMRAKGTINWDEEILDLLFQIWYIVNIMLQITSDTAEIVRYWGVIIVAPLSYVFACLPYAFVIIPMSGWHWLKKASEYFENSRRFVHGTFNSIHTENMLDFLIISGFVGQWI